ncbi:MAG: F0F1 ATP synthase subunit epsilon [Thermoanaerobacteraceae bacterium]|uniref:F0F1 ATP synthase subunit epsilon n=1 Tax=Thermanaeromonas sp. C210 TaxID=2731925 RepID=UPI00155C6B73|nr:F0F1 ATP synthase subunit epsilon [Thermanaeromonas sp. C210]MBE3580198.1 F0F1 ATP synthase subunit epsilon [Thermoanaerobacteraceae bacterium]GFN22967.1 ATP synthase epsilon chain [Thermanaeromonas sp. C210]
MAEKEKAVARGPFTMEVVTPERVLLRTEATSLVAPGVLGYLGILPGHAPMVTLLVPGVVTYREGGQERRLAVGGGLLEVADDRVVILADTAEKAEEIDVERARRAKERAERRLKERPPGVDLVRAEAARKRAVARLKAAGTAE